jgi:hypothetical protein
MDGLFNLQQYIQKQIPSNIGWLVEHFGRFFPKNIFGHTDLTRIETFTLEQVFEWSELKNAAETFLFQFNLITRQGCQMVCFQSENPNFW